VALINALNHRNVRSWKQLLYVPLQAIQVFFSFMASTTATQAPFSLFLRTQNGSGHRRKKHLLIRKAPSGRTGNRGSAFGVYAEQGSPEKPQRAPPGVDTRIHWDNEDEGWVGGSSTSSEQTKQAEDEQKDMLGKRFADLLNDSSDSHYQ
jgi:hypothetical protein